MSITSVRNFIEKTGCGLWTGIVLGVVLLGSLWSGQADCGNKHEAQIQKDESPVVAEIGSYKVTMNGVETMYRSRLDDYSANMQSALASEGGYEGITAEADARLYAESLGSLVDAGIVVELGKKNGVVAAEDAAISQALDAGIQQLKFQLFQQGKLKDFDSQSAFETAYKAATGKEWNAALQEQTAQLKQRMQSDQAVRLQLMSDAVRMGISKKFASEVKIPEEELKKSNDAWTVKRIFVPTTGEGEASARATLERALKEIKAGLAFEKAVAKYSKDLPEPNKTLEQSNQSLIYTQLLSQKGMAPLKSLKKGGISPIVEAIGGLAVYKVIEQKSNPIADFDAQRTRLLEQIGAPAAGERLQSEMEKARKETPIKWTSKGFEALYKVFEFVSEPSTGSLPKAELIKKYTELATAATAAKAEDQAGSRAAVFARFLCSTAAFAQMDEAQRARARKDRIEAIKDVLEGTEQASLRLELADLLIAEKDPEALQQVIDAARANNSFGPMGKANYALLNRTVDKLRTAKMLEPEASQEIAKQLQRYEAERLEFDKQQAEIKKEEEEQRRLAAEEAKKEAAKNKPVERSEAAKPQEEAPKPLSTEDILKPKTP